MTIYRKIYEEHCGPIPKDEDGRTYEIHHKDGNRSNNTIDNLQCVSIAEHYKIHYDRGDFGACVMIAKRMSLPSDHLSQIQKGKKRPGIGGVKKGTIPWNKGRSGYTISLTPNGKQRKYESVKRNCKVSDADSERIREDYGRMVPIDDPKINTIQRNGLIYTYHTAFCNLYAKKFNVTYSYINRILKRSSKIV